MKAVNPMNRLFVIYGVLLLVGGVFGSGCSSSSETSVPKEKISLSLGDFEAREGVSADEAALIRDSFGTVLQQTGRFIVVDRQMTAKVVAEQEFQKTDRVEGEGAAAGKIHSVRMLISGTIGKLGEDYVFNIKVTDIETTVVEFAFSKIYNGDMQDVVEDLLPDLAAEVVRSFDEH